MQLKPNTYYKTRDDRKAYILGRHPLSSTYPWVGYIEGEDAIRRWAADGNYSQVKDDSRNLLTEWTEPSVGSSAWANSLPVGTKVRWTVWRRGDYVERTDCGWRKTTELLQDPTELCTTDCWLLYTEPKLRPWNNMSEVPVDAIFRRKFSDNKHWYRCLGVATNLAFPVGYGLTWESFEVVFRTMDHSTDSGKTWLPCGVEE